MDRPTGVLTRVGEVLRTDNDAVRYSRRYIALMVMVAIVGMIGCTVAHWYTVEHGRTLAIITEETTALDRIMAEETAILDGPQTWETRIKLAGLNAQYRGILDDYSHRVDYAEKNEQQTILQVGRVLAALGF